MFSLLPTPGSRTPPALLCQPLHIAPVSPTLATNHMHKRRRHRTNSHSLAVLSRYRDAIHISALRSRETSPPDFLAPLAHSPLPPAPYTCLFHPLPHSPLPHSQPQPLAHYQSHTGTISHSSALSSIVRPTPLRSQAQLCEGQQGRPILAPHTTSKGTHVTHRRLCLGERRETNDKENNAGTHSSQVVTSSVRDVPTLDPGGLEANIRSPQCTASAQCTVHSAPCGWKRQSARKVRYGIR